MRWLLLTIALAVAPATHPLVAAAQCPGDLNGDGSVAINELVTIVNVALDGCTADPCPGDLNGDHAVSVAEIVTAVNAALSGCSSTPTATSTSTPTPTPILGHCPYTLKDDTMTLGVSCAYSGPFSNNATCSTELSALVLSDGNLVVVGVGSDPFITFGGVATSPTSAMIVAYFVGTDPTPQPLSGVMELSDDGATLVIAPSTVPPFNIGGPGCTFDHYTGTFTGAVSGAARRLTHWATLTRSLRTVAGAP